MFSLFNWRKCFVRMAGWTVLSLVCVAVSTADAAMITLNETQGQSVAGELFTFTFNMVEFSDGTDGTFAVQARGDFSLASPGEHLDVDLESVVGFTEIKHNSPAMDGLIMEYTANDVEFVQSFTIDGADLVTMTNDGTVVIQVQFADPAVNMSGMNPFAEVTLQYQSVPAPSSLIALASLAGIGLCVGANRRRKQHSQP